MIWVIAGTLDGRRLAMAIQEQLGLPLFVSVVSTYGAQLATHEGLEVYTGRLDGDAMERLIEEKGIRCIVDGSHPYASVVTATAMSACAKQGIPYIRYEREEVPLPAYDKLHRCTSEEEAAELAGRLSGEGGRVYLTTGSKTLPIFAKSPALEGRQVWTRVLPTKDVVSQCEELGFSPKYIVAMQGPFSYEMNKAMFADTGAQVVVMKNSGLVGGSDTKLEAAMDLAIPIVVIDRPPLPEGIPLAHSVDECLELLAQVGVMR